MANLDLWNSVFKTPPAETKAITGKPYKGTSPKPYYLVQRATETFGPCGIGWGVEIVSERIEEGAPGDKVHIAHVRVWYVYDGNRGVVEHVGQTMFSGARSTGKPYTDEDAPKKSVTDAMVKALSLIGFAGDIFIGRYDDSKYVSDLRQEERASQQPDRVTDAEARIAGIKTQIENHNNADEIRRWWSDTLQTLDESWLPRERFEELKALVIEKRKALEERKAA